MDGRTDKRAKSKIGKSFLAGDTPLLHQADIGCPYCGESLSLTIDCSAGSQSYFEDCEVCCRPILLRCEVDGDGDLVGLSVAREDD